MALYEFPEYCRGTSTRLIHGYRTVEKSDTLGSECRDGPGHRGIVNEDPHG